VQKEEFVVAVVGATGAVGREMIKVLEEREFPVLKLKPLASERSAGSAVEYAGRQIIVEKLTPESFQGVQFALFSAGGAISKEYCPIAAESGAVVIDNSSAWRMDPEVPLIVPEVNASVLRDHLGELSQEQGLIIANPNCSTIQMVVVLKPIADRAGLRRVVVSTYQSVSGAGKKGMDELFEQNLAFFNQKEIKVKHFPHQIAFSCIPQIDVFVDNGYTKEEIKMILETRKIMGLPELRITATTVRVPVFSCHSESVNVETEHALSADEARQLLMASPGVVVVDIPSECAYPINSKLVGTDATYVGRVRADESVDHGLNMWIVADNLRKGAALNAVQIAEVVVNERSRTRYA
jgi:aspartate-semialdehyde dehydrogenase